MSERRDELSLRKTVEDCKKAGAVKRKKKLKKRKSSPLPAHFSDALEEVQTLDDTQIVHFIKSSFSVSLMEQFWQKFYDPDLWGVVMGSFFSALFVSYNWHIIAIISFAVLLTSYFQMKSRQRTNSIEFCSKVLSKDPDRLKHFLETIGAPKNLNSYKSNDAPCEWINDILAKFWPNINSIAQTEIDKKGFSKMGLDVGNGHVIYFERFTLGDKPPAVTSIDVRQNNHRKDEINIVLKLIYFGNCLILFSYKTRVFLNAKAGVKDVYFRGNAVIVLRPILEVPPFIGGISVCLEDVPLIDYNGINLANIADNKLFKNFLTNILKSYVVSPNKIYIPLLNNPNVKRQLKYPLPIGLALIEIIEAEELPAMNQCFEGSSDSFCKIKIGDLNFKTSTMYSTLNPFWGQTFSAPIHDFNDSLKMEIFAKESLNANDLIGCIDFRLSDIGKNNNLNGKDKWLPIGKCLTGSLHFRVAVFELSNNKKNVPKIVSALKQSLVKFPIGILSVYVYYVSQISTSDEELDFKPVVKLKLSEQMFHTKTSKPPKKGYYYFEESSDFMVTDIKKELLEVSVVLQEMRTMHDMKVFGEFNIAIKDLVSSKNDMVLNREFPIKKILRLKNLTEVKNTGVIRLFISLKTCRYRQRLVENLKIASNIQANIEKTIENKDCLSNLYKEPVHSLTNPIRSMEIIRNRVSSFGPQNKTVVAEDISKCPSNLDEGSWIKIRIKWRDRITLHIEVLKLIRIPLEIVDKSYKYGVCVKLSLKQMKTTNNFNEVEKVVGLQKRYTKKYPIVEYVNDILYNERLKFKISSTNNIDDHILELFLVLYKPRMFFAIDYVSQLAASSVPIDLPKVDFKGDPIEKWCQIHLFTKFKKV